MSLKEAKIATDTTQDNQDFELKTSKWVLKELQNLLRKAFRNERSDKNQLKALRRVKVTFKVNFLGNQRNHRRH